MDFAFEKTIAELGPFASLIQIRRGRRPALWAYAIWSAQDRLLPELFELLDRDFQDLQRLADPCFVKPLEVHLEPLPSDLRDTAPRTTAFLLYPEVRFRRRWSDRPPSLRTEGQLLKLFGKLAELLGELHGLGLTGELGPDLLFIGYDETLRWLRPPGRWLKKLDELADPERDFALKPESIRYLSPERVRGLKSSPKGDLFTLATMLYEELTGALAFPGESMIEGLKRIMMGELPSLEHPRIGPRMKVLLTELWSLDPEKRPSAREFGEGLEAALLER